MMLQADPDTHSVAYLRAAAQLVCTIDPTQLDAMAAGLAEIRELGAPARRRGEE